MTAAVGGSEWLQGEFIKVVQSRGAAIIEALKKSSAASAANAAVEHVRDWVLGTKEGEWVSMGVMSDGNPYGIEGNLCFSFPVQWCGGRVENCRGIGRGRIQQREVAGNAGGAHSGKEGRAGWTVMVEGGELGEKGEWRGWEGRERSETREKEKGENTKSE